MTGRGRSRYTATSIQPMRPLALPDASYLELFGELLLVAAQSGEAVFVLERLAGDGPRPLAVGRVLRPSWLSR